MRSRSRFPMKRRLLPLLAGAALLTGCAVSSQARPVSFTRAQAPAASEPVNIWLTTTSGSDGRTVTRGLAQQTPIAFSTGHAGSGQVTRWTNGRSTSSSPAAARP